MSVRGLELTPEKRNRNSGNDRLSPPPRLTVLTNIDVLSHRRDSDGPRCGVEREGYGRVVDVRPTGSTVVYDLLLRLVLGIEVRRTMTGGLSQLGTGVGSGRGRTRE